MQSILNLFLLALKGEDNKVKRELSFLRKLLKKYFLGLATNFCQLNTFLGWNGWEITVKSV